MLAHDLTRIAAEAYRDPRTVRAAYAGRRVTALAYASICEAAARLGYPSPPNPQNAASATPTKDAALDAGPISHGQRST